MLGMMQEWPLLCHKVIDHAAIYHGQREVVSRSVEGPFHRTNYAEIRARSLKLAQRLERDGCGVGDRIATMAWNTWRHLETWYGILGIGAVYHTLNPRLFPDQIAWIMNDAEDKMLFVDLTFVKLVEMIAPKVPSLERVVILTDDAHMPETSLKNAVSYESYLAEADGDFTWAEFDERTAAGMCYTSGTTGDPEGRGLFAPLQRSACDGSDSARHAQPRVPGPVDAGGSAVSCQWLVDGLFGPDERLLHDHARRGHGRRFDL
jgi:fatty-acyl-CoA synthase